MSTKRKLLGQPMVKPSAKNLSNGNLDESRTVVSGGGNAALIKSKLNGTKEVVDISSDSSSSESADEDDDDEESGSADEEAEKEQQDVTMQDTTTEEPPEEEDDDAAAEPTFGDLVRAHQTSDLEPIDVVAAFQDPSSSHALPLTSRIQPPSGASLGTVLSQALKTNDIALLESCLHTTDVNTIRATIQRLDSPLAGTLLQKLAERLHKRPGRAGSLMVWVQWTLVTHGGYLATQKDLIKKLADLNRVIDERAKGLQSLLSLKGKLDMLEAQMELRRSMQSQRRGAEEDEEDDGVIYVEGMESDEEEATEAPKAGIDGISDAESEVSEDMPMTNGVMADSEDSEEDDSEDEDLVDDEAEETDADTGDEEDVDHDDMDSNGEDEDSDDGAAAAPPSKRRR